MAKIKTAEIKEMEMVKIIITANHSINYNGKIYLIGDVIHTSVDLEELLKYGELV